MEAYLYKEYYWAKNTNKVNVKYFVQWQRPDRVPHTVIPPTGQSQRAAVGDKKSKGYGGEGLGPHTSEPSNGRL